MPLKLTILCRNIDFNALSVLYYFLVKQNYPIDSIIIETCNKKKTNYEKTITWKLLNKRFKPNIFKKISAKILYLLNCEKIWHIFPQSKYFNTISMKRASKKLNIPCYTVNNHSSMDTKNIFDNRLIDYALLISSKYLIKKIIIDSNTKIINAHCALLPYHRSLDSLPWSVMSKDKLGITTHFIDEGIDTGDILLFEEIKPSLDDDLILFRKKLNDSIPSVLYNTIIKLENNEISPVPQKVEEGTRHKVMTLNEFNKAEEIFQEIIKELYK